MARAPNNYDTTSARRQARRRVMFLQMRDAIHRALNEATTLEEAKAILVAGLTEEGATPAA